MVKAERRIKGNVEVAQALYSGGMDYEKVKKLAGLTDEELKALKHYRRATGMGSPFSIVPPVVKTHFFIK